MTLRSAKSLLACVLALGIGLALAVTPAAAAPLVLDWRVIGAGSGTTTCLPPIVGPCTVNLTGPMLGTHIGSGSYSVSVTTGNSADAAIGSGGTTCFVSSGSGTITAANGDTIAFNTVGWLCQESSSSPSLQYNGTYRITSGSGRFIAVGGGGGNLSATLGIPALVSFIKIDGTINY